jgi:hypothetical protein
MKYLQAVEDKSREDKLRLINKLCNVVTDQEVS